MPSIPITPPFSCMLTNTGFLRTGGYPGATVPYSLIRYVISGRAVFSLGDTSYDVGPDDVFYIPQGSVLSCAAKEEIAFISIRFVGSVQLADTDMLCALWNVPFLHNFSDMPEMWTYFERAYASALTKTTFKYLEIRGYLNLICAQLARVSLDNFDKDETLEEDRKKMEARFDIESIRRRAVKSATQKKRPAYHHNPRHHHQPPRKKTIQPKSFAIWQKSARALCAVFLRNRRGKRCMNL